MTNKEKYKEVFGFYPDTANCPTDQCDICPGNDNFRCKSKVNFWDKEYVEPERPQAEWKDSHILSCGNILNLRMNVIEHRCEKCGRWSIQWERTIPDNFCSNCGTRMRGKNNET